MSLLKVLHDNGYLTETNVSTLIHFSQKWKIEPYDAVLDTHIMSEQSLADAIADIYKLDRIYSFDQSDVDINCLKLISFSDAKRLRCLIPNQDEDGTLQVFILNPLDEDMLGFLRPLVPKSRYVVLDRRLISKALEEFYPLERQIPSLEKL